MEMTLTHDPDVNVPELERWISVVGGGVLAIYGATRGTRNGTLLALLGGGLAWRGISGHSRLYEGLGASGFAGESGELSSVHGPAIRVERAVTIRRPIQELWRFWRNLENLPQVMRHIEQVLPIGANRFHWVVRAPIGTVSWDAEILGERENEYMAWRSVEGSEVENAGSVRFRETPAGDTEVRVSLAYQPPAGPLGAVIARLFGQEPSQQIGDDLDQFKQLMESGDGAAGVAAGPTHTRRWESQP